MNDTPRVTVPVEPIQRLILAADSYGVRYLDSDDMSAEAEELQAATEAMKDLIAAPAPEGGAVWFGAKDYEPTDAMIDAGEYHNHRHNSLTNLVASFKAMMEQAEIDGLISYAPALATREEAPAGAGAALGRLSALLSASHLAGDAPIAGLGAVSWNDLRAILDAALRAQPQAREEAQPVARVSPDDMAKMTYFADNYGTIEDWHVWCRIRSALTTPPAPEAEKLRVAVEALEPFAAIAGRYLAGGMRADLDARAPSLLDLFNPRDFYRAHKAIAALQQAPGEAGE